MGRDMVEEEQVPPPNSAADPVDDDSDTEELLEIEGAELVSIDNLGGEGFHLHEHTMEVGNIIKAASIIIEESSVSYEVETSSATDSTTTVTEEHGAIVSINMEVIELKYDCSEEVTELELGSFRAHNPHCPHCSHRITKIILRKRNIPRFKRRPVIEKIQTTPRPCLRKENFESAMVPSSMAPQHSAASQINDVENCMVVTVDICPVGEQPLCIVINQQRSRSLEILKCIVYGGLMESIASFSIVCSASASDATTLNVVVIGLATLFGGLIVFVSNLVELRHENSNEKYERVLGRREHFAFHSTLAVLSYLVFGLIAPITYGITFRESGDKDYKILAVAAAAFGSVFLLSIAKAYASRGRYVKTTLCYIMLAVSASGVTYAAGDFIGDVLNTIGMFRDVPAPGSGWASY